MNQAPIANHAPIDNRVPIGNQATIDNQSPIANQAPSTKSHNQISTFKLEAILRLSMYQISTFHRSRSYVIYNAKS